MDDVVPYVEIGAEAVEREAREAAETVLAFVTWDLDLAGVPITVRWFRPAAAGDVPTFTSPRTILGRLVPPRLDEIWIRADRPPRVIMETSLHELRHVYQHRRWVARLPRTVPEAPRGDGLADVWERDVMRLAYRVVGTEYDAELYATRTVAAYQAVAACLARAEGALTRVEWDDEEGSDDAA